jgi:hypothetical protein
MKYRVVSLLIKLALFALPGAPAMAQGSGHKMSSREYVELHKEEAVKEMQLFGIPASITLAQGILESDNGNSPLAVYANNHFGIKCHEDWTGATFTKDDDAKDECFRKYATALESFSDHSLFLKSRVRYAYLFTLKTTDYRGWARGLKESGYATDPRYTQRLLEVIDRNKLYELDKELTIRAAPELIVQTVQPKPEIGKEQAVIVVSGKAIKEEVGPRRIETIRDREYVIARDGDSFESLARSYMKGTWELPRYNELDKKARLVAGQRVYLQPKHRRGDTDYHYVKSGETMYSISQEHCIRLKLLYRKNKMQPGTEPKIGEVLFLKKRKR